MLNNKYLRYNELKECIVYRGLGGGNRCYKKVDGVLHYSDSQGVSWDVVEYAYYEVVDMGFVEKDVSKCPARIVELCSTYVLNGRVIKCRDNYPEELSFIDVCNRVGNHDNIIVEEDGYIIIYCSNIEEKMRYYDVLLSLKGYPFSYDKINIKSK